MKNGKIKSILISLTALFTVVTCVFSQVTAVAVYVDETKMSSDNVITARNDYVVAPGITETHIAVNNSKGDGQVMGYAVDVDLNDPTTGVIVSYKDYDPSKGWGMQKVRDQAYAAEKKLGVNVVAGVNGDFYDMGNGAPRGNLVMQGVTYSMTDNWSYFAIKKDGTPIIGSGHLDTADIKECIGGAAVIARNGRITDEAITSSYTTDLHPRTGVGIKADGSVVMYVSDGRQEPMSKGQTFVELAEIMIALGCVDVLALDGGGSSTFISQHEGDENLICRNKPSDGNERVVSSALLVYSTVKPNGVFDHASILPLNKTYSTGSSVELTVSGVDSAGSAASLPKDGKLVLADSSFGKIENSTFVSNGKTGTVKINYISDGRICGTTSIEIVSAAGKNYTGFSRDEATGKLVYYINGVRKTGWFAYGRDNYCFNNKGIAMSGEVYIGGHTYTFDSDGKLVKGSLEKNSNGRYSYYLNGKAQRGWFLIDGYWYYFDRQNSNFGSARNTATIEGMTYTFGSDSRLKKGCLYQTPSGTAYYWGPNPVLGLYGLDGSLYYFDNDTYMLINESAEVGGKVYSFGADGKFAHYGVHVFDENGVCHGKSPFWTMLIKLLHSFDYIADMLVELFS